MLLASSLVCQLCSIVTSPRILALSSRLSQKWVADPRCSGGSRSSLSPVPGMMTDNLSAASDVQIYRLASSHVLNSSERRRQRADAPLSSEQSAGASTGLIEDALVKCGLHQQRKICELAGS